MHVFLVLKGRHVVLARLSAPTSALVMVHARLGDAFVTPPGVVKVAQYGRFSSAKTIALMQEFATMASVFVSRA